MPGARIRIDAATHEALERLSAALGTTVGDTVTLAVRGLRQDRMGTELTAPLYHAGVAWLDVGLG
jgi:hypothetical protein